MNKVTITYEGSQVSCDPDKSILENLITQDIDVTYSCQKGSCLTCVMKTDHDVDPKSRAPLKPTLVEQGYFLGCQQKPNDGMVINAADQIGVFHNVRVTNIELRGGQVAIVRLTVPDGYEYRPGQFVNIIGPNYTLRSYSIASIPLDDELEIHVKEHEFGTVSRWLCDKSLIGQEIEISEPEGQCFYLPGRSSSPLLLIGTGTGLAPLIGIIRDALSQGHDGKIELYHGAVNDDGLYLIDELQSLSSEYDNLSVHLGVLNKGSLNHTLEGAINDIALSQHHDLTGWRVFLCGDPDMVKKTKTKAYLADAALSDILADPFDIQDVKN
ncbi:2Fe-2S iron-sulfur cluster-binding protein [Pseudemcibacter aquimaris]|uniref:2Fe-2S iron-sulfur cluster-binding protein n=1 Tax=Pseudemcibacter aquimaris TaxID=2857064 RepID=UPI002011BB33|nr:2Fe-2S iron-sulfur cluster-binding protein [Pseudemcibacter aquimaris]MCC3861062.1 2Fe-2S iron-sulfur cluster binding domain-containing protein [Pseudemcibacter aquimaris]WDU59880.1 2Fe-2S iron-sulfur cluster binding domain-containing protein [Pseudemcibacter aquimaris]